MAAVQRFEDLRVWQMAHTLCVEIFKLSERFGRDYRFLSQITSAAGSIMDNIAEGFERDGRKEFVQFLFFAKGSCGEVRSQLIRAFDFGYISESEFEHLRTEAEQLSCSIFGLIKYLRNANYSGTKYKSFDDPDKKSND